tara:strand:- start:1559 stop:1798 length:240 start_codon:yes stop_codon:yes gene_type:complete
MDDASLELTIQMGDLEELARINPVAWEQLLHIVDNRQNAERIAELEEHLAQAHGAVVEKHRLITKAELDNQNGAVPAVT